MNAKFIAGFAACAVFSAACGARAQKPSVPPVSTSTLASYTNCDDDGNPKNANLKLAYAETDLSTPWRVSEVNSFKRWAEKLCVPHFIWNQANEDVSLQISNVADLLAQKPTVLLLSPYSNKPLMPTIGMAQKAGVPMISVDRELAADPGPTTFVSWIGGDNYTTGQSAANGYVAHLKAVQKTDNPKANVAIIMGGAGEASANERNQGVEDALKPYPGIKILAVQSGDWTRDGGRKVMAGYIQRFPPGTLQGVYAASDEEMIGARQALEAANRTDLNGAFFSSDGQLQGLEAVADGFDVADSQFAPLFGGPSLQAAIAISQGVKIAPVYYLVMKTFTCLTPDACNATKEYVAQLKATGAQF